MKKTILLVEDDLLTVDVYETALRKAGFELEVIKFGGEAIEKIKKVTEKKAKKPDLLLLDLILPDINGIEVLKETRKHEDTKDLPVFILTNYSDRELEKMGYDLKVEKYILKTDCVPSQLIKLIKKRLKK